MNTIGKAFRDWWPVGRWIIAAIVAATLGYGKLYWDVENLKSANNALLVQRIVQIEKVLETRTGDDAFADWTAWRATMTFRVNQLEAR